MSSRFFVTGGAGFLGSNLVNTILDRRLGAVTVLDSFLTGRREHFGERVDSPDLTIVEGDAADTPAVARAVAGHDVVFHLAANSDIARAANEPLVDFDNGTRLAQSVLEAMREEGVKRILFSSGSGVYGEVPPEPLGEDFAPMVPISTYGASKLACEALISAYCHMFDFVGTVFRFANVVGPHMTHGVSHDFVRRLTATPRIWSSTATATRPSPTSTPTTWWRRCCSCKRTRPAATATTMWVPRTSCWSATSPKSWSPKWASRT